MALTEAKGTRAEQEAAAAFARARQAAKEAAQAEEAARTSDPMDFDDGEGATWAYVTVGEAWARIEGCTTEAATVRVPDTLAGLPVRAIAAEAFANIACLEQVDIPACVEEMGTYAFRRCVNLRVVHMPCAIREYDSTWFNGATKLEELQLPDAMEQLRANVFDSPGLRVLEVGRGTREVAPGAFAKSKLERFGIHAENAYLKTDGIGVYTADGTEFLALAKPVEAYRVADGVTRVGRKATSSFSCVCEITLPDTVEQLDDFAFMRASIAGFVAPPALRRIGAQAFSNCRKLVHMELNEGLKTVGDEAFAGTALERLRLPASVEQLGIRVINRTPLTCSGSGATFSIAAESPNLWLDDQGCLYAKEDGGLRLIRIMDGAATEIRIASGTRVVGANAFSKHAKLRSVVIPEGAEIVEEGAFRECKNLASVEIPRGLRRIEKEAFLDTVLASVFVPASLEHLGRRALVVYGAHHEAAVAVAPSLRDVQVEEGQTRFYKTCGMLCERKDCGTSQVVVFDGSASEVVFPEEVTAVADYAFSCETAIDCLRISDRVSEVGMRGLAFGKHVADIYVDVTEPIDGQTSFHFAFPNTLRGARQQVNAFGVMKNVDVAAVFVGYDLTITNSASFTAREQGEVTLYQQLRALVQRMRNPVLLKPVTRDTIEKLFDFHLVAMCVAIANELADNAHEALDTLEGMVELGFVNAENASEITRDVQEQAKDAPLADAVLERLGTVVE